MNIEKYIFSFLNAPDLSVFMHIQFLWNYSENLSQLFNFHWLKKKKLDLNWNMYQEKLQFT